MRGARPQGQTSEPALPSVACQVHATRGNLRALKPLALVSMLIGIVAGFGAVIFCDLIGPHTISCRTANCRLPTMRTPTIGGARGDRGPEVMDAIFCWEGNDPSDGRDHQVATSAFR